MKFMPILLFGLLLTASWPGLGQEVSVIRLPELEKLLEKTTDTTYVINFWATWCGPCVNELPGFEQLHAKYARSKVKVILVSMDFVSQLETKVKPLVKKRGLKSEVYLLNEPDYNAWIDKVDNNWSGAIPFTLIINNRRRKRKSFEKELTYEALQAEIQAIIQ